jgi:predicted enzyme related to lactoylglutathione lyase
MLAQASVVGFIPVKDLQVAEAFYGETLGLTVSHNDGYALVLTAAQGVMIRCALTPNAQPLPSTILGWEVDDVAAAARKLKAAGVSPIFYQDFGPTFVQDEDGMWTAPDGSQVAWFHDPFGNVLSLSHHAPKPQAGMAK